jgi:glycosyltransferase involved in cell wall biosynthesis
MAVNSTSYSASSGAPAFGSRPLRIAIVTNYSLVQVGGAEEAIDRLATYWHQQGHAVAVFCPAPRSGQKTRSWEPQYQAVMMPAPFSTRFGLGRYVRMVQRACQQRPGDVILACDSYWAGHVVWCLAQRTGTPYVVCSQGSDVMHGGRFLRRWLPRRRMERVFLDAAGVVAISRYMQDRILDLATPQCLRLIPNGWPDEWSTQPSPPPVVRGRYILGLGRMIESKGFQTLVRAFAQVRQTVADVGLVLCGDGPYRDTLHRLAAELGIPVTNQFCPDAAVRGLCLPGFVHGQTKRGLIEYAAVGVSPSLRQEPMSLALFEMLACGVPVLGSRVGGTPDIVLPEVNGLLFSAADNHELAGQLIGLLTDEGRRSRLANKASASVDRFRWSRIGEEYLDLFRQVSFKQSHRAA